MLLAIGLAATAGDVAARDEDWEFALSPYFWVPHLTNTLEAPFGDVTARLSREFDRSIDGAALQVELNGPILGATYRF